jgi:hypothetical protein
VNVRASAGRELRIAEILKKNNPFVFIFFQPLRLLFPAKPAITGQTLTE